MLDRFKSILTSFRGSIASKSVEERQEALQLLLDGLKDAGNFTAADEDKTVPSSQFSKLISTLIGVVIPKPEDDPDILNDIHREFKSAILNESLIDRSDQAALRNSLDTLANKITALSRHADKKSKLDEPLTPPPKKPSKRTEIADDIRVSIANVPNKKVRLDQGSSRDRDDSYSRDSDYRRDDRRDRDSEDVLDALSDAVDDQRAWLKDTMKDESARLKQTEVTLKEYMRTVESQMEEIHRLTDLCARLAQENAALKSEKAYMHDAIQKAVHQLQQEQQQQQQQQQQLMLLQQQQQQGEQQDDATSQDDIDLNADPTDIDTVSSSTHVSATKPATHGVTPTPSLTPAASILTNIAAPVVPQLDLSTVTLLSLLQQNPLLALAQLQAPALASQQHQQSTVSPHLERKTSSNKRKRDQSSYSSSSSDSGDDDRRSYSSDSNDSGKHKSRKSSTNRSTYRTRSKRRNKSASPGESPPPVKSTNLRGFENLQVTISNAAPTHKKNIKDRVQ